MALRQEIIDICNQLQNNTYNSPKLKLIYRKLTVDELALLMASLEHNTNVKELDLGHNKIDDDGAALLALNTTLTSLVLCDNNIGDRGAASLALNKTLTSLNLVKNKIGDSGATSLALNTTLERLHLSCNKIGDAGAASLALNTTLERLDLGVTKISYAGAMSLALNTTLINLILMSNNIGDAGAASLALNTTLRRLNLVNNNIGDAGAASLALNTTITSLDLSNNKIGAAGMAAIEAMLKRNREIEAAKYWAIAIEWRARELRAIAEKQANLNKENAEIIDVDSAVNALHFMFDNIKISDIPEESKAKAGMEILSRLPPELQHAALRALPGNPNVTNIMLIEAQKLYASKIKENNSDAGGSEPKGKEHAVACSRLT